MTAEPQIAKPPGWRALLLAWVVTGCTLVNFIIAIFRWGPSFLQLGLNIAWFALPAWLIVGAKTLADRAGYAGLAPFGLAVLTMVGGTLLMTTVPPGWSIGWTIVLVPLVQLVVAIPLRVAAAGAT